MLPKGLHFVAKNCGQILLNKDSCQRNLVFLLPSTVLEGSGLDVMEKELVDAETEHGKIYVSSSFRRDRRNPFSGLCPEILENRTSSTKE